MLLARLILSEMGNKLDAVINQTTLVRAKPEIVYNALTTAEGLDSWFTTGSFVEARPGGKIIFRWKNWGPEQISGEDGGPVLEAPPPARFVFQWHPDDPSYATTVKVDFEAVSEGTIVRLREQGYEDTPSGRRAFADCASGWGEALTLLKFYVEHGLTY
jgi:uncharacterized protein YndB with AHSA1/START domain